MKTTKSKAAYTNKWLSRNKQHWKIGESKGTKVIILTKPDVPKIVSERVYEINKKRIKTHEQAIYKLVFTINKIKKHP